LNPDNGKTFTIIIYHSDCNWFRKDEKKDKRGRGWPFLEKKKHIN